MSISSVISDGYGSWGSPSLVILDGYVPGAAVIVVPITPQQGGAFDAGFGKWFNTAWNTSGRSDRRIKRDTEIGQMLDELVFKDEIEEIRGKVERTKAEPIIAKAAERVEKAAARSESDGMAEMAAQFAAYRNLFDETEKFVERAYIAAMAEHQAARYRAHRRKVIQDDEFLVIGDLLI